MRECANCDVDFGYDAGFDDPPEGGDGHIQVTWKPENEPSFVVSHTHYYCSTECLLADSDTHPFREVAAHEQ